MEQYLRYSEPAYLPQWPQDEEFILANDPIFPLRQIQPAPPPPPPPVLSLPYGLAPAELQARLRLKESLNILCIDLLMQYDELCECPHDRTRGVLQRLLAGLYSEETYERAIRHRMNPEEVHKFQLDYETVVRLNNLKHTYPIYNRLFGALRATKMSIQYWCIVQDIFRDGKVPPLVLDVVPLGNQYENQAALYADRFFSEEELAYGKKKMLMDLARLAQWTKRQRFKIEHPLTGSPVGTPRTPIGSMWSVEGQPPTLEGPGFVDFSSFVNKNSDMNLVGNINLATSPTRSTASPKSYGTPIMGFVRTSTSRTTSPSVQGNINVPVQRAARSPPKRTATTRTPYTSPLQFPNVINVNMAAQPTINPRRISGSPVLSGVNDHQNPVFEIPSWPMANPPVQRISPEDGGQNYFGQWVMGSF
ncbi:hypothetical protein TWF718_006166 [Orbilia javanica]|uniref:Uncharacterized protein n=1 Tax=Orbilia javanica TaxID=47235 RepID=A0AAN8RER6_9PEZI